MSILEIISQETGLQFKKAAKTGGGEYQGPCPWCGGNDRFVVHLGRNLYWCRKCNQSGDKIKFIMDYKFMDYPEACRYLRIPMSTQSRPLTINRTDADNHQFTPASPSNFPCAAWQSKMQGILFQAYKALMSANGAPTRAYLLSRGITAQTIKRFRLGWMSAPATFGIDSGDGTGPQPHRVPAGILIPWFRVDPADGREKLFRIRCRVDRNHPAQQSAMADKYGPYQIIKGAPGDPMVIPAALPSHYYVIVESELDGILINQDAGDLVNVIALGSSTARPDTQLWAALTAPSSRIILSLDFDKSGELQTTWWLNQFHNDPAKITVNYPPDGKDPGEMVSAHRLPIRPWVEMAIEQFATAGAPGQSLKIPLAPNVYKPAQSAEVDNETPHEQGLHVPANDADTQPPDIQSPTTRPLAGWPNHYQDTNRDCLHGKFCQHLARQLDPTFPEIIQKICLIANESVFQLKNDECPKRLWGRWDRF